MKIDLKAYAAKHPHLAAQVDLGGAKRAALPSGAPKPGEEAEQALQDSLSALGIAHETQYRWHPVRKWRADVAIPAARLLVEIDGEVHRVHRDKWHRDMEKANSAVSLGWATLRFSPDQAVSGTAALEVERWLKERA